MNIYELFIVQDAEGARFTNDLAEQVLLNRQLVVKDVSRSPENLLHGQSATVLEL